MPTIIGFATATPQEKDGEQNSKLNLQKIELISIIYTLWLFVT